MTPQQIGHQLDVEAQHAMFRRTARRRATALRWIIWRTPQALFLVGVGMFLAWSIWSAMADISNWPLR